MGFEDRSKVAVFAAPGTQAPTSPRAETHAARLMRARYEAGLRHRTRIAEHLGKPAQLRTKPSGARAARMIVHDRPQSRSESRP
jgi:hypothetical protein